MDETVGDEQVDYRFDLATVVCSSIANQCQPIFFRVGNGEVSVTLGKLTSRSSMPWCATYL